MCFRSPGCTSPCFRFLGLRLPHWFLPNRWLLLYSFCVGNTLHISKFSPYVISLDSGHNICKWRLLSSSYTQENLSYSKWHSNVGSRLTAYTQILFRGTISLQITPSEITTMLNSLWRGLLVKSPFFSFFSMSINSQYTKRHRKNYRNPPKITRLPFWYLAFQVFSHEKTLLLSLS